MLLSNFNDIFQNPFSDYYTKIIFESNVVDLFISINLYLNWSEKDINLFTLLVQ